TNAIGNTTEIVDPLGRTTEYEYASNNPVDLREIAQVNANGGKEHLMVATYNSQHLPLTITDASTRKTTYTYNSLGQVLTVTNPKNEVTTFNYDGNGYLTSIDGPLTGNADSATFTYDSVGRVKTVTNSDGYVCSYTYDDLDRVTRAESPSDNTFVN